MKLLTWLKYRGAPPQAVPVSACLQVLRDLRQLVLSNTGREVTLLPVLREIEKAAHNMVQYCEAEERRQREARREAIIRREIVTKFLKQQHPDFRQAAESDAKGGQPCA